MERERKKEREREREAEREGELFFNSTSNKECSKKTKPFLSFSCLIKDNKPLNQSTRSMSNRIPFHFYLHFY